MNSSEYRTVIMAHGLEGSPNGAKVQALRAAGLPVIAPDGRERVLADRVRDIQAAITAHPNAVLVGSSYGGLAALAAIQSFEQATGLRALVLLAPALGWREPPADDPDALVVPHKLQCIVFHGRDDDVVVVEVSHRLVKRCPHVELRLKDDGHRLTESLPSIVECVERLARREADPS